MEVKNREEEKRGEDRGEESEDRTCGQEYGVPNPYGQHLQHILATVHVKLSVAKTEK